MLCFCLKVWWKLLFLTKKNFALFSIYRRCFQDLLNFNYSLRGFLYWFLIKTFLFNIFCNKLSVSCRVVVLINNKNKINLLFSSWLKFSWFFVVVAWLVGFLCRFVVGEDSDWIFMIIIIVFCMCFLVVFLLLLLLLFFLCYYYSIVV